MTFKSKSTVEILQITDSTVAAFKKIAKILEPYNGRLPIIKSIQTKKVEGEITHNTLDELDCGLFEEVIFGGAEDTDCTLYTSKTINGANSFINFNLVNVFIKIEKPEKDEIDIHIATKPIVDDNSETQIYYTIKFICFSELVKKIWNKFNRIK